MSRRLALAVTLVATAATALGTGVASGTGVSGEVARVIALEARPHSTGRLGLRLTATVPRTRLTVTRAGGPGALRELSFSGPVAGERLTVRLANRGQKTLVLTAGPRTP